MRSLLFVPADSERKLAKGLESGADALIIDLEDSVALEAKPRARQIARAFIEDSSRGDGAPLILVRINDLASGLAGDDIAAIMPSAPFGIMLPKSLGPDDVASLGMRLRVAEAENGLTDGATRIVPIVTETARAVIEAGGYHRAAERLVGITWGAEDLSADIGAGATRGPDGRYTDVFRHARLMTILAASAAEVPAIDTVYPDFRDEAGFRGDSEEGERDGFTARMAIHPAQVPIINEVFNPSAEAVEHAIAVVAAFEDAGNPGVVAIAGKMFDRPHLVRAKRLLARAGLTEGRSRS
jgi:citrate lyase subunit beta / citryl-CoA lyase